MFKIPLIAAVFMLGGVLFAQTHQHPAEPLIDGKVNPELIPDVVAYRLYFASISPHDTDTVDDLGRRTGKIVMLKLHPDDQQVLLMAMQTFGAQYRSLILDYNAAATAAWNANPQNVDPQLQAQFLARRDALVESTVNNLSANLSIRAWVQLAATVKAEKSNMKIQGN